MPRLKMLSVYKDTDVRSGCNLKNDNLQNFYLEKVALRAADLDNADLNANLKHAALAGAKGLTAEQVKVGVEWQDTFYDESFCKQLGLPARES
jgi:uncharacterized protein YjbI with pentapeptide repeats